MAKKSISAAIKSVLPKVQLTVNDVEYSLVYDFNAMAVAEEKTGLNLLQCLTFENINATKLRGLLYAALLRFHPEMTLEDAGNLLGSSDSSKVMNAIVEAYVGSQPQAEAEPKNVQVPENS